MRDEEYFIKFLMDYLNGQETAPRADVDWAVVLSLAKAHEVGGIVYYQCKNFLPDEYRSLFANTYNSELFFYVNRVNAMGRAAAALSGLSYCTVKGLEVAQYYPVPALRTMGDCDIVVEPASFAAAIEALRAVGFKGRDDTEVHEWPCQYRDMHFEVHDILVRRDEYSHGGQLPFFNDFASYIVEEGKLDWSFHFLFLLMHLRKHFVCGGVGIRQFMDLAVVIRNGPSLDWPWIEEKLRELQMRRFAYACFSLIEDWFEVQAPVEYERLDSDTIAAVTKKVLANGVFGFADEENRDNGAKNAILFKNGSASANRLSYFFSNLFPGYMSMKRYPGCGFLIGRRYLLPAAWLWRFGHILTSKDIDARLNTVRNTFIPEQELEKRRDLMTRMGLME